MYQVIGMLVVVGTVIALFVMAFRKPTSAALVLALGIIGIGAGLVIPNLTVINKLQMSPSHGISAEMVQRGVQTVQAKAEAVKALTEDVRGMEKRMESLTNTTKVVSDRVKQS